MDFHKYICPCGKKIEATGPRSLCMFVRAHEGLGCPIVDHTKPFIEKTDAEILVPGRYTKPLMASTYDPRPIVPYGGPIWTANDYSFLADLKISPLADLRGEVELAKRYRTIA